MTNYKENTLKFLINIAIIVGLRFVPHIPNVEPIMASIMPWSKKYGALFGMTLGFFSIILFDIASKAFSNWSFLTATTYALIGYFAGLWLRNRANSILNYTLFSLFATIAYDLITGIGFGVFLFHQSLTVTLYGQIPFTLSHLIGNTLTSVIISPFIYSYIIENRNLETSVALKKAAMALN